MATRLDIQLVQGDDPTATIKITRLDTPYDLTGRRLELLVKASRSTPDLEAMYQLSSEGATPRITITEAPNGLAVVDFVDQLALAGLWWYRAWTALVADPATDRQTFNYGIFEVIAA